MREFTIFHSPDADDAFMFYGLTCGAVTYPGFSVRHELCDIESLNKRALKGELEVSALSVHAYPYVQERYLIMRSGASMGGADYGPMLIAKRGASLSGQKKARIAIPGKYTSAALALKLYLAECAQPAELVEVPFEKVGAAVASGSVDAGVLIHEGQLTFKSDGFDCLVDLGKWWWDSRCLPLPLGVNVVRRDLGPDVIKAAATVLYESIAYSLAHRSEAIDYALSYGRGLSRKDADQFVGMYVNDLTLDLGDRGCAAIERFLQEGRALGAIPSQDLNSSTQQIFVDQ